MPRPTAWSEVITAPTQRRFLQQVIDMAPQYVDPERTILYGSRARGEACVTSDYDLAFVGLRCPEQWSRFVLYLDEHA